ncbi:MULTISPECIES: adenosine kinase [Acinetobacter]|uniref:Adenosine kinase n=1 Tax=Acinetobacter faecalis TaxID=2665161 RepID=A0ABU5GFV7_9GAMM|nr:MULTISPECIES: adenosine kinase [Acinetobacter]MDY6458427.1 adenosine kinase [Acinetobacter faecalis]MDY6483853.1 adenosine kinase [Acinetobacter faecalis]MDY6535350.1 adenosine kinase [Acinetobacter faecalis]MDY6549454.1 adenosine kinase [Acinetobacter faecalis]WFP97934.1 adenosine kinase [Acinetobacter sp. ANC 7201]
MATVDLFAIGNALIDQEFKVSDDFLIQQNLQKGTMQLTDGETQANLYNNLLKTQSYKGQASGGSAANTTVAFSALGGSAFYACRVGNDELGSIYLNGLNDAGITTSTKSISEGVTGTCMVLVSEDSERTMHTYLGITAELTDEQIDFTPLNTAKWLYIEGYLSTSDTARLAVKQAREIAKANGVKIALTLSDPAMVQYARQGLNELLDDGVDLLFCNEQEALMYTETDNIDAALAKLKLLSQSIVITLSSKGALISNSQNTFTVAGREVVAVDTNGAGDAFAGSFLYALNAGLNEKAAAEIAVLISSQVVAQFGPRLAVHQYAELLNTFNQEAV